MKKKRYEGGMANKIYVQICLYCNMKCRHCCYDCGPNRREFMSVDTFAAAVKCEPKSLLNVGGGEPTCHPEFWEMMALALRARGEGRVWIATNGKREDHALLLGEMVRKGEIRGVLSQDEWHEPISQNVVQFWKETRDFKGNPVIRNIGGKEVKPVGQGRCDWGLDVCNGHGGPWVMWDGSVRQCGCLDAPVIGDVVNGYDPIGGNWFCAAGRMHPDRRHLCKDARVA
jgi:hypothetical protein